MNLDSIVPFGRSFEEHNLMFALDPEDAQRRILGVGDGPASFNAEGTKAGWRITSIDPIYRFSAAEIEARFHAILDDVIAQVVATPDQWSWSYHRSPESLRVRRVEVAERFAADFAACGRGAPGQPQAPGPDEGREGAHAGRQGQGRYVAARLPELPFADDAFDLALCSHLLFLYSSLLDLDLHLRSLTEMLRVAPEARIFPLLSLDGARSRHLAPVMDHFARLGYEVAIRQVGYELQRGGNEALILRRP